MENSRKQVSGLEAAIAAMVVSGMDENSPQVMTLKGSLAKGKRNAQEAPIAVQVKGAQEFVDQAQQCFARVGLRNPQVEVGSCQVQSQRQSTRPGFR